jgi:hypothetical protein
MSRGQMELQKWLEKGLCASSGVNEKFRESARKCAGKKLGLA